MKVITTLIPIFLIVLISKSAGVAAGQATEGLSDVQVSISVLSFNCSKFDGHVVYTLRSAETSADHHATASKIATDDYLLTFAVQPGHYQLLLDSEPPGKDYTSSRSALCETQQWFTALPDHERHLAVVLGSVMTPHSDCSIAGSLPAAGFEIELVLPKGHMMTDSTVGGQLGPASEEVDFGVEIDGSAYYIEHVPVEDFVLRFGDIEIPMDLTKSTDVSNPYCQGEFVHNISRDELRRAFPAEFVTE